MDEVFRDTISFVRRYVLRFEIRIVRIVKIQDISSKCFEQEITLSDISYF